MVSTQLILAGIFVVILSWLLYDHRKKIQTQGVFPFFYIVLLKTKLGLNFMDSFPKRFPKLLTFLGYTGVIVGFLGMILIVEELFRLTIKLFMTPETISGAGLVLPFGGIPGSIVVPFMYWILSIFIIAVIHESSHGIIARLHGIKLKSSGFAFFGIIAPLIPAAFVEPDEKQMAKKPKRVQLAVFAAGPFSNILTGILFVFMLGLIFQPIFLEFHEPAGIKITALSEDGAAASAGIMAGEIITRIDDHHIMTGESLVEVMESSNAGKEISITTTKNTYMVIPKNIDNKAVIGVSIGQHYGVREGMSPFFASISSWLVGLFFWLQILSIGIGLFNLVPIGPIDGGRMLKVVTDQLGSSGKKIFSLVSFVVLALVAINVFAPIMNAIF